MLNQGFMRFGGGGDTFLTPLGIALLLLACILILAVKRKYMIVPLLFATILIPISEQIVVFGLHFTSMRILIACAWLRLGPYIIKKLRLTWLDRTLIAWAISGAVTFSLLWLSVSALVNRLGILYDCFGLYFVWRILLPDREAVYRVIKALSFLAAFLGVCLLFEHIKGIDIFSALGGKATVFEVRNGSIRAIGPFSHEILAGCFGATLMPLFAGLWWQKESRMIAVLGMVGATLITYSSFSSTALLAWGAGMAALMMWPLRRFTRILRWSVVVVIIGLQMVMKAPVWALIGRIDLTGGSSGYHRFELVNQAILHFSDWWLLGVKTTYQWGYNLWDTANTYVETATTGGLCTLVLLITMIVISYKALGKTRKATTDPALARLTWILGSALFAHLVAFVGITYYDQTIANWYLLLAMISVIGSGSAAARVMSPKQSALWARFANASREPEVVGHAAYGSFASPLPPTLKEHEDPFLKPRRG
jgi:hypothetical protein